MERALELAGRALYDTDPNPAVGCIVVSENEIVAEGWTQPAGGPHAEIVALAAAGARAAGATVYVTFEPCCHTGRTGPCTTALIEAGVARVVYAIDDPNPAVAGRGAQALRAAGIEVLAGPGSAPARKLNSGFISRMERGRPFVRLKIAASLDGRTALSNGVSQWITGAPARADVHRWRARSSAVLTGSGTVLADDPRLTARPRDLDCAWLQPLRVVLDSSLRVSAQARMFEDGAPVLLLTCAGSERSRQLPGHVEVARVSADDSGHCDLNAALELLARRQINDVWVEGGRRLSGAMLKAGLVDELIIYTAPVVLGEDALGMFALGGLTEMAQRLEFTIDGAEQIGRDLRVLLRPSNVANPLPAHT
jgi:diaminohydroxyphosphoribosylaminopyrimidine deaminase/5-amino-6-(5-phosphoribosylamino)uracil reductase